MEKIVILTKKTRKPLNKERNNDILFLISQRKVKSMSEKTITVDGVKQPKTKVGQIKMDRLINAAEELFTTKGFYQTSITDICKSADTAVGTFYIYFQTKTDIYRYMMKKYERELKNRLSSAISNSYTRYEKEREGIKCFIKYAVENPNIYNIIWGSLSVERELFTSYYESFARSYTKALEKSQSEISNANASVVAYILMGISNFLGLCAMFENMSDADIDRLVDEDLMPALSRGIFKQEVPSI